MVVYGINAVYQRQQIMGIFVYHMQSVSLSEKKKFLMFSLVMMLLP